MDNCVLCGKQVDRGGYSTTKIPGVILRPLCLSYCELCDKEPKRIADEHRELFERMLAEKREQQAAKSTLVDTTSAGPQRSPQERALVRRYDSAYLVSRVTVAIGTAVKVIGVVLALLIVVGALLLANQIRGEALVPLLAGVVLAAFVGMVCYAYGTLLAAEGQTLMATLDSAVHSSPFLSNELRAEIMSL
jgi:hypothetical protein